MELKKLVRLVEVAEEEEGSCSGCWFDYRVLGRLGDCQADGYGKGLEKSTEGCDVKGVIFRERGLVKGSGGEDCS